MALTSDSIATSFADGETVLIETPNDYNTFIDYICANTTNNEITRYASITADLDFLGMDFHIYTNAVYDLMIDGNYHTIRNAVYSGGSSTIYVFCRGGSGTPIAREISIQNLTVDNCDISGGTVYMFHTYNTLKNVHLTNCIITASGAYYGIYRANIVENVSSNCIVYAGNIYYGAYMIGSSSNAARHCAWIDIVYWVGTTAQPAYVFYPSIIRNSFTRNKFVNWSGYIYGISDGTTSSKYEICYAAIICENCTSSIYPVYANDSSRVVSCYYDKTLIPNATRYTERGLTTEQLKSKAEMQSRGWIIEVV